MPILRLADDYFKQNPKQYIARINYEGKPIWAKRRPNSKKMFVHKLQYLLTLLPIPIFYPTTTQGGAESLKQEAERLKLFAAKGIAVPLLLAENASFIVTSDVGQELDAYLGQLTDPKEKRRLLEKAAQALLVLHQAGLCHGRPALHDMTYHNDQIFFIDLEEAPLTVMSLAQAQARDVWLFLLHASRRCKDEPSLLPAIFEVYARSASLETLFALRKMVSILKPLGFVAEHLFAKVMGRDLRCAIAANKAIEQHIKK